MNKYLFTKIRLALIAVPVLATCIAVTGFRKEKRPGSRPIIFYSEKITRADVEKYLFAPEADSFVFVTIVKKSNGNREQYDLNVYVFDKDGNRIERDKAGLFTRMAGSLRVHQPAEDVNLSVYGVKRKALEDMTSAPSRGDYRNLIFEPRQSFFAYHVDYYVHPDDVTLQFSKENTQPRKNPMIRKIDDEQIEAYAHSELKKETDNKLTLGTDYIIMNPSPPARRSVQ